MSPRAACMSCHRMYEASGPEAILPAHPHPSGEGRDCEGSGKPGRFIREFSPDFSPPGISPEEFQRHRARMRELHQNAPAPGDPAPDFDLPVLNGDGRRVRLSSLRGRPVGLVFGSYT